MGRRREEIWTRLIPALVRRLDTIQAVLARHGVPRSTAYSRYFKHPEFQRRLAAEQRAFDKECQEESRRVREKHFGPFE